MRLSTPRARPPASHRRGRSPLPSPPRDRADGATPARRRRARRPAHRDTVPRACRKRQAPPLPNRLRFREGGGRSPPDSLRFPRLTSRKRNHRLAALRPGPRHDLSASSNRRSDCDDCGDKHPCLSVGWGSPHLQSLQRRCGLPRQSSNPPVSVSRGDERDDFRHGPEGGASPTLHRVRAGLWRSSGRAGHGIVPAMRCRPPSTLRTMPMPGSPPGAPSRCPSSRIEVGRRRSIGVVAALPLTLARPRRWGDARESLRSGGDSEGRRTGKSSQRSAAKKGGGSSRCRPGRFQFMVQCFIGIVVGSLVLESTTDAEVITPSPERTSTKA